MPAPIQQSWPRLAAIGVDSGGQRTQEDPAFIAGQKNNWLVLHRPLWKIWVRQLGWWHSQYMKKCSKSPTKQFFFPYFFLWTWSLAGPECKKDTKVDGNLVFFWFVTIFYFSQFFQHTNRPPKKRCSTFKKSWRHHRSTAGASDGHILRSK